LLRPASIAVRNAPGSRSRRASRRWPPSSLRFRWSWADAAFTPATSAPPPCRAIIATCSPRTTRRARRRARGDRASAEAQRDWANWRWEDRAAVFLRAAELLTTSWRDTLNAATMLGQSKTVFQSEIDAACELIDFWRFNSQFAQELYAEQPMSDHGMWNQLDYRPLEGFVYAVSPFNFTAIGGNLSQRPRAHGQRGALEARAPPHALGALRDQLLDRGGPAPGRDQLHARRSGAITRDRAHRPRWPACTSPAPRGVQEHVEDDRRNMGRYRELSAHRGRDRRQGLHRRAPERRPARARTAMVRGAFEYQGQKCSAASRAYIPKSLWPDVLAPSWWPMMARMKHGRPARLPQLHGRGDRRARVRAHRGYIERAKARARGDRRRRRGYDRRPGWFVEPTMVQARGPTSHACARRSSARLTVYVYDDAEVGGDARAGGPHVALRADGRRVLADRRRCARRSPRCARGRQLLRQRQADGRRGGQQPFGGGGRRARTTRRAPSSTSCAG
jgi:1-pyrroline-5-carboxylate dehydrogenase